MMTTRTLFLLFFVGLSPCALAGNVVGILDGDTLDVLEDGKLIRIRLSNIDAPEKSQAFGQASKRSLSDLCFGAEARFTSHKSDRYGRTVATVSCNGIDVNTEQVRRGLAWVYVKYNKDPFLPAIQVNARANRIGIWSDKNPIPPWEFRHSNKTHVNTP